MTAMGRWGWMVVAIGLLPVAGSAQEGRPRGGPPAEAQQHRMELERQVRHQFMGQVARRLDLSEVQRDRLHAVLEEGAEARRALAGESRRLRQELMAAVRDERTPMSTYDDLLARIRAVRQKEQAIENREAAVMSEFLDARQQAVFLMLRMQLNDRVRRMHGAGGRGPGGGPGGGMTGPF